MQYTDKELNKLIEEVEKEFTAHLTKAEEDFKSSQLAKSEDTNSTTLAKAEDEKPKKEEEKEEHKEHGEEKPEATESEHKPEGDAPEGEAPQHDEKPAEGHAEEEHEDNAAPAEGEDHCDYDDEDMGHMHKMYSSMSKGELKAHHEAVKQAYEHHGLEKCGEMMGKSETDVSVEISAPNPEIELLKTELDAQKAKSEELKKTLDTVTEFVTKLVSKKTAPAAKAFTSLDVIAKSESSAEEKVLTKSEITAILSKKVADPSLAKSDREAINAFYLNGASINSISHLLK